MASAQRWKETLLNTAVDTNIVLDFLAADPSVSRPVRRAVASAVSDGPVVLCSIVYAELCSNFVRRSDLDSFLLDVGITIEDLGPESLWRAAEAWKAYLRRRGQQLVCPSCGQPFTAACPACQTPLVWRQHIITDFLIGGHALVQADQLLTRDRGYYRTYFPQLRLITP